MQGLLMHYGYIYLKTDFCLGIVLAVGVKEFGKYAGTFDSGSTIVDTSVTLRINKG